MYDPYAKREYRLFLLFEIGFLFLGGVLISFDLTFFLRNQARRKILGNWYKRNKLPNSCKPSLLWISSSVSLMKWEDNGFGC